MPTTSVLGLFSSLVASHVQLSKFDRGGTRSWPPAFSGSLIGPGNNEPRQIEGLPDDYQGTLRAHYMYIYIYTHYGNLI